MKMDDEKIKYMKYKKSVAESVVIVNR